MTILNSLTGWTDLRPTGLNEAASMFTHVFKFSLEAILLFSRITLNIFTAVLVQINDIYMVQVSVALSLRCLHMQ